MTNKWKEYNDAVNTVKALEREIKQLKDKIKECSDQMDKKYVQQKQIEAMIAQIEGVQRDLAYASRYIKEGVDLARKSYSNRTSNKIHGDTEVIGENINMKSKKLERIKSEGVRKIDVIQEEIEDIEIEKNETERVLSDTKKAYNVAKAEVARIGTTL